MASVLIAPGRHGAAREVRTRWGEGTVQDLRYAIRSFRRTPAFTLLAVLTLALGIGLNTGLFAIVKAVLLRPLPFPEPERLVAVVGVAFRTSPASFDRRVFASASHYVGGSADLTGGADAVRVPVCRVSSSFFSTLGVSPSTGRAFDADPAKAEGVAVISHGLWQRQFGGQTNVLGSRLRLNSQPYEVIGVAPRGFGFPGATDVWVASDFRGTGPSFFAADARAGISMGTLGRLRPGVTLERALAAARSAQRADEDAQAREAPGQRVGRSMVSVALLHDRLVRNARPVLLLLSASLGFVLLVACANVANMLLARGMRRRHELAVRASLGASRWRLVRQLVTEAVLLASLGSMAGLLVAWWSMRSFVAFVPPNYPGTDSVAVGVPLDLQVVGAAFLAALVVGLLTGLAPARQLLHYRAAGPAPFGAWDTPRTAVRNGLRGVLIFVEVTACVSLVAAAGLVVRSLLALEGVELGFRPGRVVTMDVSLPEMTGATPEERARRERIIDRDIRERLGALGGAVDAYGSAGQLPLSPGGASGLYYQTEPPSGVTRSGEFAITTGVSGRFFQAMGIDLLRGRTFDDRDVMDARPVAVVSETLASRVWPGQDAIGKRLKAGHEWLEVVGVVRDVRFLRPDYQPAPQVYLPKPGRFFVFRSALTSAALSATVRSAVRRLDKNAVVARVQSLDSAVAASTQSARLLSRLLSLFSALALVLAALGVFAVVSYLVDARRREMGIRLVLGARPAQLVGLLLAHLFRPVLLGVSAGALLGFTGGRLMKHLLFGVVASDPYNLLMAGGVAALVAVIAALVPVSRAVLADPVRSLHQE